MKTSITETPRAPRIFVRAALLTSRRLPLGQGTDAELLAYVRWAQTFGGESIPQLTSATATAAIAYFLSTDEHWRRHKNAKESSPQTAGNDDTDEISIPQPSAEMPMASPSTRPSPGRRPRDSQPAPLAFMPPDLLRTRSFNIPASFANELDRYVAWLAEKHDLASAVVTALAVDRAFREFLRLDTAWQKYRQRGQPDSGSG
jgi:hypothetical protein